MADDNGLHTIATRHAQDDVWFKAGHHDPNGYIGMAHKDRGEMLKLVGVSHETSLLPKHLTPASLREWMIANGFSDLLNPTPPPQIIVNPMIAVPKAAWDWLMGEGPDDKGKHFGDDYRSGVTPAFWWRTTFRRMCGL